MRIIRGEARLSFAEAASIIVGHGVGSGILAVPYLASKNSIRDIIWIIALAYAINLVLHLMVAELSFNNSGAQFIKCIQNELFKGKIGKALAWVCFGLIGFSVLANVCGFIIGGGAIFQAWLGIPVRASKVLYFCLVAFVVLFGMKLVGICEKISVFAMVIVITILLTATFLSKPSSFENEVSSVSNMIALFGMISFSLSSVMSVPQVVKGLEGDAKKVRASVALGEGINVLLISVITFMTIYACGNTISQNGALVDLAGALGGWVAVIGYIFSLLALSTSFWANTLNLRDIIHEQTGWGNRISYVACSVPGLLIALLGNISFVGFTRLASVIQVLTGVAIIVSYAKSRKREEESPICGIFGTLAFRVIVIASTMVASAGAVLSVK